MSIAKKYIYGKSSKMLGIGVYFCVKDYVYFKCKYLLAYFQ